MLAPPPEGTFDIEDIEDGSLPMKTPPKDGTPEQVPLLTEEEDGMTNSNASKKIKVRK